MTSEPAITGIQLHELKANVDERGSFIELHRDEWGIAPGHVQWNAVHTHGGFMRGVHVHKTHDDYMTALTGRVIVGLADLRPESASYRVAECIEIAAEEPRAIKIPHGVAHGFYMPEPTLFVYSVSHYWSADDELACRWNDPEMAIPWPVTEVRSSQRDAESPPLAALLEQLAS